MSLMGSKRLLVHAAAPLMVMGGVALPLAASTPASAETTHQLTQQVITAPSGLALTGPTTMAPSTVLTIDVAIDSQLTAKQAAVTAIYTPGNLQYHHFFTSARWDAAFGVKQATYDSVVNPLVADGMKVLYKDETNDLVELSATAAEIDTAFHVVEQDWSFTENSGKPDSKTYTYYANNVAPTVDANVDAVQGLTDVGFVEKEAVTGKATPMDQNNCNGTGATEICTGSLEGTELRQIYNVGATYTGQGQALAVNGDGDTEGPTADLHKYESDRSLPAVQTVFVNTDHDTCVATGPQVGTCDTSGEGEWALDSTSSTAMAPSVTTLYYFFPSALGNASGFQAWADYNSTASGPIPMQENASWGECESYGTVFLPVADGTMVTYTNAFVDAAGKGKTQFVSAGDLGAGCLLTGVNGVTPGGPPQVQWPCSSQWVVCVGGTVIYGNGQTGSSEGRANLGSTCTPTTGVNQLNECGELSWSHTGGGTSHILPAQPWQAPLTPFPILPGQCVVDPNGNPYTPPGPECRGVPDVSALSGDITVLAGNNGNGFNDVEGGTPDGSSGCTTAGGCPGSETVDGGTSLSDPLWEGMWADVQSDPQSSNTWGFAAPLLYQVGENPAQDECAFYDVQLSQAGSNFAFPPIARDSADPTGWDYTSGLGSPNVQCLETELAANQVPAANTPEAPDAGLLLVIPGFAGAAVVLRRRRRSRATA